MGAGRGRGRDPAERRPPRPPGGAALRLVPRIAARRGVARAPPSGQSARGGGTSQRERGGGASRGAAANGSGDGRGPAGGTCGRARVRVGPPRAGRDRHRDRARAQGQRHRHRDRARATRHPHRDRARAPGQQHRHRDRARAPGHRHRDSGTGTEPGHRDSGTGTGTPALGQSPGTGTAAAGQPHRHLLRDRDTGTGNEDSDTSTAIPALGQGREQRHRQRGTGAGTGTPAPPQLQPGADSLGWVTPLKLNPGRGSPGGGTPAMEPPAHTCSCGSPASDSEAEAGGSPRSPPKLECSRKRPGGLERAPPESPPSPRGGKRPRKGEGGDVPPSDGDRLFAQKCRELRGFIRPLAELLEGLRRGRYDRGLSSFQQSVAMDRLQRIIGVLQKPEMGARYLGTLLQVEAMLRLWFPHVTPKPELDPAPPAAPPRRRPPAGPPGAPRCRRLPGDLPLASPAGTVGTVQQQESPRCQAGTPESPPASDV